MNFKNFCESLEQISFRGKDLIWTPNKTDAEFKKRIKGRTGLNEIEFYKVLREGLTKAESYIPKEGSVCLYYAKSRFVLILNLNQYIITTIRDANWDKPTNGCDKTVLVEEQSVMVDWSSDVFFGETEFEGYLVEVVGVGGEFAFKIHHHCDVCVEVDA